MVIINDVLFHINFTQISVYSKSALTSNTVYFFNLHAPHSLTRYNYKNKTKKSKKKTTQIFSIQSEAQTQKLIYETLIIKHKTIIVAKFVLCENNVQVDNTAVHVITIETYHKSTTVIPQRNSTHFCIFDISLLS